jgi:hypothetical protein
MKSELLVAYIYDMALVGRLADQASGVLSQYDIRYNRRLVTCPKLLALTIYLGLCRLVHPSRRTLGEELAGITYPHKPLRTRLRWVLSGLSMHVIFWGIIPLIKEGNLSIILDNLSTLLSDTWFLLTPSPSALSLLEQRLRPSSIFPKVNESPLKFPKYLFAFAAFASIVKSFRSIGGIVLSGKGNRVGGIADTTEPPSELGPAFDPCPVCICEVSVPTAMVCGHILCWSCALAWTTSQADGTGCPTCRTPCTPQELVPLVHYAPGNWKPAWRKPIRIS